MAKTARTWLVKERHRYKGLEFIAVVEEDGALEILIVPTKRITREKQLADAHLISAAPDMFEGLSELEQTQLLKSGGVGMRRNKAVLMCLRALNKARGATKP